MGVATSFLVGVIVIKVLLVAVVSEVCFLVAILIGSPVSSLGIEAIGMTIGSRPYSAAKALLTGAICGSVAGIAGLWVATALGRSLSLPEHWLLWVAVVPPLVGEYGYLLNRFSLRVRGEPDTGVFAPLGRWHQLVWYPLRSSVYHFGLHICGEGAPDTVRVLALRKADWFLGRVICAYAIGVAVSMTCLAAF
jgi:hypothetical protein